MLGPNSACNRSLRNMLLQCMSTYLLRSRVVFGYQQSSLHIHLRGSATFDRPPSTVTASWLQLPCRNSYVLQVRIGRAEWVQMGFLPKGAFEWPHCRIQEAQIRALEHRPEQKRQDPFDHQGRFCRSSLPSHSRKSAFDLEGVRLTKAGWTPHRSPSPKGA